MCLKVECTIPKNHLIDLIEVQGNMTRVLHFKKIFFVKRGELYPWNTNSGSKIAYKPRTQVFKDYFARKNGDGTATGFSCLLPESVDLIQAMTLSCKKYIICDVYVKEEHIQKEGIYEWGQKLGYVVEASEIFINKSDYEAAVKQGEL